MHSLPTELLKKIASHMAREDFCSFRLTCKGIDEKTRDIFCTFLRTQQINMSLTGLERMRAIAGSELAPEVHVLIVKSVDEREERPGEDLSWRRSRYLLPEADVKQWSKVLGWSEVLGCLVNCTSFHLIREGQSEKAISHGIFTSTDVITVILNAIVEACIPVRRFFVDFIPDGRGGDHELDLSRINVSAFQELNFINAWEKLETLQLSFTMNQPALANWIELLVLHATQLRVLMLEFDDGYAANAIIERLSSIANLSKLQELTLRHATKSKLNGATLGNLLCRYCKSLTFLSLHCIMLDGPGWKTIFKSLIKFPSLENFSFGALSENRDRVHFPNASGLVEPNDTIFTFHRLEIAGINTGVSCQGPGAKAILGDLVQSMQVSRRPRQPANSAQSRFWGRFFSSGRAT